MGQLTGPRENMPSNGPTMLGPLPIGAGKKIWDGAIVARDDATGFVEPATAATGKTVLGIARVRQFQGAKFSGQAASFAFESGSVLDNTNGSDGDLSVMVEPGPHVLENKGGDLVTAGVDAYVEDDQTVRATGTGSSKAGFVVRIEEDGRPVVLLFCPNNFA